MKTTAITMAIIFLASSLAAAAPTPASPQTLSAWSTEAYDPLGESVLIEVTGGLNRNACIGVAIGLGLGWLAAGAATGGVGWILAGAYAPAIGALACSL